jgi:6-phosphogluconolactonase
MDFVSTFPDRAALMAAAAERIADALRQALADRGAACAALSGGTTPEPAYRLLAEAALDWRRVSIALVDERFVPPGHPASNEALLRRALAPALARGAGLVEMFAPGLTPTEAAAQADARYAPLHFDIAVMGMGADGHTASWFPGADGLDAALDPDGARSVVALHAPKAEGTQDRLSMTFAALRRARRVLLLIAGEDKRARLAAALAGAEDAPVAALFRLPAPPEVLWAA